MQQGSDEWFAARLGYCTASRMGDVLAKVKTGEAAGRRNYRMQLVVERLTGVSHPGFVSQAMLDGIENEPLARMAYEVLTGEFVEQVGFVEHPRIPWFGASPDGQIGDDGLLEIKCPLTATHVECMLSGKIPNEHRAQMLAQLSCTGRRWVDFVSFDPKLPESMRLFVARMERVDEEIDSAEKEVIAFLAEVEEMVNRLMRHEDARAKDMAAQYGQQG